MIDNINLDTYAYGRLLEFRSTFLAFFPHLDAEKKKLSIYKEFLCGGKKLCVVYVSGIPRQNQNNSKIGKMFPCHIKLILISE